MQDVSALLRAWNEGDPAALDELAPIVYDELHKLAHLYMARERSSHSLQTTALVNEAYLRLVKADRVRWQDRRHFIAVATEAAHVDAKSARVQRSRGDGMRGRTVG